MSYGVCSSVSRLLSLFPKRICWPSLMYVVWCSVMLGWDHSLKVLHAFVQEMQPVLETSDDSDLTPHLIELDSLDHVLLLLLRTLWVSACSIHNNWGEPEWASPSPYNAYAVYIWYIIIRMSFHKYLTARYLWRKEVWHFTIVYYTLISATHSYQTAAEMASIPCSVIHMEKREA